MTDTATAQAGTGNDGASAVEETTTGGAGTAEKSAASASQTAGGADAPAAKEKPAGDQADVTWRHRMAGEDKKFLKTLERYTDEPAFGKAHQALLQKMSSGEYKRELPKDAKPEDVTAWRKENGLPEKADGYLEKLSLPNGVVLGDADKPTALGFAEAAMDANLRPDQYSKLVAQYYKLQDAAKAQREEADSTLQAQTEDALRVEWGPDYRRNINVMGTVRDMMPSGLFDALASARDGQGRLLGNLPEFTKWMVGLGRELNPAATMIPAGMGDTGRGLENRVAEFKAMIADRREDKAGYYRGPNAQALQAEYRQLLEFQGKQKSRAA